MTPLQRAMRDALNNGPAGGLTITQWALACNSTVDAVRQALPGLRDELAAQHDIVIPRPTLQNHWRYEAVYADDPALLLGEEARLGDAQARMESMVRDSTAAHSAHLALGNTAEALWWQEFARHAEFMRGLAEGRLDAVVVRVPPGAAGTSRGRRRQANLNNPPTP